MKRLALLLCTFGAACSQTPVASGANLVGAHDLVQVGDLLFTTSTDRDELRVLDLFPAGQVVGVRQYVRAPNPIEALSIPVLGRPSALARDTRFEDLLSADGGVAVALGNEAGGPWVYATRAGGAEISVVGGGLATDPTQLMEAVRIPTANAVTASAGVRLTALQSRLYFATSTGDGTTLLSIDLPTTVAPLKAAFKAGLLTQKVIGTLPGEVVVDLLIVPGLPGRGVCGVAGTQCLVVATRQMQGRSGRVLLLDPASFEQRELRFPGPIRLLAVHAGTFIDGRYAAPGERVFGVLDEELCGSSECSGVVAVDTLTGEVAIDSANLPMIPISVGNALPTGLTVVARGQVLLPPSLVRRAGVVQPTVVALSALGVITTSNGSVIFFDAAGLSHFDLEEAVTSVRPIDVGLFQPDGTLSIANRDAGTPGYVEGPVCPACFDGGIDAGVQITFADGAWNAETISITINGQIPGLVDLPVGAQGQLEASPGAVARAQRGDTIRVLQADGGVCSTPVADVAVTQLTPGSSCAEPTRFTVRAAGADPYVITASETGYLGRSGPSRTFSYRGTYLQRILRVDADNRPIPFDPTAPTFTVVLGPERPPLAPDWFWSIDVQPRRTPFILRVDAQSVGCSTSVASSVVYDLNQLAVFAVFPSANAIIEINPLLAQNGVLRNVGRCWP